MRLALVCTVAMLVVPLNLSLAGESITGKATWYRGTGGHAAAGSELRQLIGKGWRGDRVRVCRRGTCRRVVLSDWCGCPGRRIIDLDRSDFKRLANPDRGVIRVRITTASE